MKIIGFLIYKIMELIKIREKEGKQVVSARELHLFLEVKTDFKDWMPRMLDYGFEEGKDFSSFLSESNRGRPAKEYAITLDCAKEISMIQRSEKGKQARLYFIECEKKLMETFKVPKTFKEALLLALEQQEKIEEQEKLLIDQKPKVEFANQLLESTNGLDFATSAKTLNLPFGRNKLFEICRDLGLLMPHNQPYQSYIDRGYFVLLETSYINPKTHDRVLTTKTLITAKGQAWLLNKLKEKGHIK